ncbi:hypothetical protein F5Y16DRAFT_421465 [Xylariaceae sp. FL0255]|nr:hypothetical protein F5Y16DRAFT_421465 [Xylariaceae sp. FL0255]
MAKAKKVSGKPTVTPKSAQGSGGGGEDLPPFDFNLHAGKSSISGTGVVLPRLKLTHDGKPSLPPGTGPQNLEQLQANPSLTSTRTGSLPTWGGNDGGDYHPDEGKITQHPNTRIFPFLVPLAELEKTKEEAEKKEAVCANRESRLPRKWSSDPADFKPIMKNTEPGKREEMIAPWSDS